MPAVEGVGEGFAVWSPDGTAIAFMSNRHLPGEPTPAIFVMDADGTNIRKVGPDDIPFQAAPDFSPDGARIVFAGGRFDAGSPETDLYVMGVDGSGLRRLTDFASFISCPRWSPDGERILFSKDMDELLVIEVASGEISEVLPPEVEGNCGDWSPDGSRLAFASGPDRQLPTLEEMMANPLFPMEIFVFDLGGGELTHLPQAGPQSNYPRWARDGRRIVFQGHIPPGGTREPGFTPTPDVSELYVVEANGSDVRRLTSNALMDVHPNW